MKTYHYVCLSLVMLLATLAAGQPTSTSRLVGAVLDKAGQPAAFVTVRLQAASDTTFLTGAVCDESGRYVIERVAPGTYRVVASQVGHRPVRSVPFTLLSSTGSLTVRPIQLTEDTQTLNEVSVRATKPFVEHLPDRTVLNVESSPIAAGGTVLEVLERAPGVVVDQQNDRIRLQGRDGVLIMMDDKPTYLSISDVVNLLRNTPANGVETIELITKPSARYDAAGNGGIINIRLKRARPLPGTSQNQSGSGASTPTGTNGNVSLTSGYGRFPKIGGGVLLNHRTASGWSLFGNDTYDYREQWGSVDAWRTLRTESGTPTRCGTLATGPAKRLIIPIKLGLITPLVREVPLV